MVKVESPGFSGAPPASLPPELDEPPDEEEEELDDPPELDPPELDPPELDPPELDPPLDPAPDVSPFPLQARRRIVDSPSRDDFFTIET
jgi:hypothetical protein